MQLINSFGQLFSDLHTLSSSASCMLKFAFRDHLSQTVHYFNCIDSLWLVHQAKIYPATADWIGTYFCLYLIQRNETFQIAFTEYHAETIRMLRGRISRNLEIHLGVSGQANGCSNTQIQIFQVGRNGCSDIGRDKGEAI